MKEGEEILFVLPSFMAYRSTGDKNGRIGSNEPIVTKIKLTKIKQSFCFSFKIRRT